LFAKRRAARAGFAHFA